MTENRTPVVVTTGHWPKTITDRPKTITYYHGGPRGLDRVGWIFPPSRTGVMPAIDFHPNRDHFKHVSREHVFLTTDPQIAEMFAAMHPSRRGAVYEVRPFGEVVPDPDYLHDDGASFQAPKAMILRVVKRVKFSRAMFDAIAASPTDQ